MDKNYKQKLSSAEPEPTFQREEDGYDLWLRYRLIEDPVEREGFCRRLKALFFLGKSPTIEAARTELESALTTMIGTQPKTVSGISANGTLVVGTARDLAVAGIAVPIPAGVIKELGPEGFRIITAELDGNSCMLICAQEDIGVLYGIFHLLRLVQTRQCLDDLNVTEFPKIRYRVLNHWDNGGNSSDRPVGRTERVYSDDPRSIFWDADWPPVPLDRYRDYARACASIGLNVSVINNVNANADVLLPENLKRAAAIADILRPYGVRVALCPNYGAPLAPDHEFLYGPGIGILDTTDPDNPDVKAWWQKKIDEIYSLIPDFAGFLIKSGSEGMPGPELYGKEAWRAANLFAELLAPWGGIVMWRTFTWDQTIEDHVQRQYVRFQPMDGMFADNVLLQCKYGPRDFMPREPLHPLFGSMPNTQLSLEVQITQEYLGHDKHLVFLPVYWKEMLDCETFQNGKSEPLCEIIDGSVNENNISQIAGVANISRTRNWTGHDFGQANWYGFGRLAWNHRLDPEEIAEEWVRMTWSHDTDAVQRVVDMMTGSHEAAVNYFSPLGLAHTMQANGHYDPTTGPEWPYPAYEQFYRQYVGAGAHTIGYDRTMASGSGATAQYNSPLREQLENAATCPEKLLIWFHRLPWDHRMKDGKTLWQNLLDRYRSGVDFVESILAGWENLKDRLDPGRHQAVKARLEEQLEHVKRFSSTWIQHFHKLNGHPLSEKRERM